MTLHLIGTVFAFYGEPDGIDYILSEDCIDHLFKHLYFITVQIEFSVVATSYSCNFNNC